MNWFAAELHCHTLHSDGKFTVEELCRTAREYDLDGIALTDHNTLSGWRELTPELAQDSVPVLKGIEWTTFFGHMLVLGCPEYVDWRDALPDTIDEKIQKIREQGGLVGIAHPFALGSPMCTGCYWDYHVTHWENVNYMEVWSEGFPAVQTANQRSLAMWNSLLDAGFHIAATYGKDWHGHNRETVPGACTYLGISSASLTPEGMKEALRLGRTAITMGPKLTLELERENIRYPLGSSVPAGEYTACFALDEAARRARWERFSLCPDVFRLVGRGGRILCEIPAKPEQEIRIPLKPGWVRGELWGAALDRPCCLAMTSPFYVTGPDEIK